MIELMSEGPYRRGLWLNPSGYVANSGLDGPFFLAYKDFSGVIRSETMIYGSTNRTCSANDCVPYKQWNDVV